MMGHSRVTWSAQKLKVPFSSWTDAGSVGISSQLRGRVADPSLRRVRENMARGLVSFESADEHAVAKLSVEDQKDDGGGDEDHQCSSQDHGEVGRVLPLEVGQ